MGDTEGATRRSLFAGVGAIAAVAALPPVVRAALPRALTPGLHIVTQPETLGVVLPRASLTGDIITVVNASKQALKVFPAQGSIEIGKVTQFVNTGDGWLSLKGA